MGHSRPLFIYLLLFSSNSYTIKIVDFGIQTRIAGVYGKVADHLTTTNHVPCRKMFYYFSQLDSC